MKKWEKIKNESKIDEILTRAPFSGILPGIARTIFSLGFLFTLSRGSNKY